MRLKIAFIFVFLFILTGCSVPFLSSAAVLPSPEITSSPEPSPSPTPTPTPEPFADGFDLCGKHYTKSAVVIDLRGASAADINTFYSVAPFLSQLRSVDLGNDVNSFISWKEIRSLQIAAPDAEFLYSFHLYEKGFTLSDSVMDLNHIRMNDQGALVREVIACMPNLRYLDMDFCYVDDEHMAAIRNDFPDVKVVWRIWFGGAYSVRTDVEKILASAPGTAGDLKVSNTSSLKYCTDVKYLDIGHNEILKDISFVAYMPKLEVAILAMLYVEDISPLSNCSELEYLEIQTNNITDLSPLKNLKKLHHLNIAYNFNLKDITPLYGLKELERLWIGALTPIPEYQVAEMHRCVPNCVIETTYFDPHDGWRYGNERYDLLIEQFGYDKADYSFSWKDPLYEPHS